MKQMQDFNKWLFAANAAGAPQKMRLAALTRLSRAQLSHAAGELTWFFWEAPQAAGAS